VDLLSRKPIWGAGGGGQYPHRPGEGAHTPVDLAIIDVALHDSFNGIELVKAMKAEHPALLNPRAFDA